MNSNYAEALVEVNEILKFTPTKLTDKIPNSFKDFIVNNMSKNYTFNISPNDNKENLKIKDETKTILALIYRNYFTSTEEREYLLDCEKSNLQAFNEKNIISVNDIFPVTNIKAGTISNTDATMSNVSNIIPYRENFIILFFKKIINKFKKY